MWFAPLLRSFHSGSRRPRAGRGRPNKRPKSPRVRLQLEMLEDRRVPSSGLVLFDPFAGLLADGFHAPDFADSWSAIPDIITPVKAGPSGANSTNSLSDGGSANVGSSTTDNSSQAQGPVLSNSNVPTSQFLGAIANRPVTTQSVSGVSPMLGPSPASTPPTAGPLFSVTSINSA